MFGNKINWLLVLFVFYNFAFPIFSAKASLGVSFNDDVEYFEAVTFDVNQIAESSNFEMHSFTSNPSVVHAFDDATFRAVVVNTSDEVARSIKIRWVTGDKQLSACSLDVDTFPESGLREFVCIVLENNFTGLDSIDFYILNSEDEILLTSSISSTSASRRFTGPYTRLRYGKEYAPITLEYLLNTTNGAELAYLGEVEQVLQKRSEDVNIVLRHNVYSWLEGRVDGRVGQWNNSEIIECAVEQDDRFFTLLVDGLTEEYSVEGLVIPGVAYKYVISVLGQQDGFDRQRFTDCIVNREKLHLVKMYSKTVDQSQNNSRSFGINVIRHSDQKMIPYSATPNTAALIQLIDALLSGEDVGVDLRIEDVTLVQSELGSRLRASVCNDGSVSTMGGTVVVDFSAEGFQNSASYGWQFEQLLAGDCVTVQTQILQEGERVLLPGIHTVTARVVGVKGADGSILVSELFEDNNVYSAIVSPVNSLHMTIGSLNEQQEDGYQYRSLAHRIAIPRTENALAPEREVDYNRLYVDILTEYDPVFPAHLKKQLTKYVADGVDENSITIGAGERAAVLHSYFSAYGKLPHTIDDWEDVIKISNGRWPRVRSEEAEEKAEAVFEKVYLRKPTMENANDNAAITIMAYGLRQRSSNRNLDSERAGIRTFEFIFGHVPSTTEEWNILQAITYSGAVRW